MKKRKICKRILFFIGLMICSYPLLSGIITQWSHKDIVATYQKKIECCEDASLEEQRVLAAEYNSVLYQLDDKVLDNSTGDVLSSENYNSLLNLTGNGMMGSIEIPKIDVNLPIYHGTSEEVLSNSVGHIEGTSLPIGGVNTRTVLSGHRGLPNSKLFTRLDELEAGDFFFIKVMDEILAYKVTEIEVIFPDETDKLKIVPEKDLATLLTCTPYGLNTHRLLVTGERVVYNEVEYQLIEEKMMSFRELFFGSIPFIFIIIGIGNVMKESFYRFKLYKKNKI